MARKSSEPAISFMVFGYPTYSWSGYRTMACGVSCVLISARVCSSVMARSSSVCTKNMNLRANSFVRSERESCGAPLSMPRLRLELPTCFTRTLPTKRAIRRILAQFNAAICAQKSFSTQMKMRWRCAIWPASACPSMLYQIAALTDLLIGEILQVTNLQRLTLITKLCIGLPRS